MSGSNPCEPGDGNVSVIELALSLVGDVREGDSLVGTWITGGCSGVNGAVELVVLAFITFPNLLCRCCYLDSSRGSCCSVWSAVESSIAYRWRYCVCVDFLVLKGVAGVSYSFLFG